MHGTIDYSALGTALAAFISYTALVGWVWSTRYIATNARDELVEQAKTIARVEGVAYEARQTAQKARDDLAALIESRERDRGAYDKRLERAEAMGASVDRLAEAVRSGAQLTAIQIENLAGRVTEHASYTKEQFATLTEKVDHAGRNAAMAREMAARQRASRAKTKAS